uniref:Receptor-like serine/threonine-protein kinase n=1 Tax=Nelumbo nucifera TaxID=4432 RepID=A0A822Y0H9_NELNU|nr:TPA_asm: hypothetical protein HUJ06_024611 [Nelumbo nucifera]
MEETLWFPILCCLLMISFFSHNSFATGTLTPAQSISDGERQTLVSSDESFELGFFSPGNSKNRYLGIWYRNIPETIVWVANRNNPILDATGVLKITEDGNLVLLNKTSSVFWSSISSSSTTAAAAAKSPVAQLLDSGNFVLRDESNGNSEMYVWQSFDFPSDTLLPGMKLGLNFKTNLSRYMTSWKKADDPALGDFSYSIDISVLPQLVIWEGSIEKYRSGPWNGVRFSGVPVNTNAVFRPIFISDTDEVYYMYERNDDSTVMRFTLNPSGSLQRLVWNKQRLAWDLLYEVPQEPCDRYDQCGANGLCKLNYWPICDCLKGFTPKLPGDWNLLNWSAGCVRRTPLDCRKGEGFAKISGVKLPDLLQSWVNETMNLKECEVHCLNSCSCVAYARRYVSEGGCGCILWFGDLTDIREFNEENGEQDLYVRMASSEMGGEGKMSDKNKRVVVIVSLVAFLGTSVLALSLYLLWKSKKITSLWKRNTVHPVLRRKTEDRGINREKSKDLQMLFDMVIPSARDHLDENFNDDTELLLFDFDTIANATDNFSNTKMLGKGGFGCVYKGDLVDGQEIAVKRLGKNSEQGAEEFKNEVRLIAKLQHRNLVRLLGCCISREEKMLIYEYMRNKSLNSIIFDKTKSTILDWQKRFDIIGGIARGLLYLHQDSRFRIVHRDLKASNVLLDGEMNPKISDFGMARIFGEDQTEANTRRIVGTYGYMSPEYAMDGLFSVKSDVFSFGVLVLEIISGNKNTGFYTHSQHNLLGHAWRLWREGKALELVDSSIGHSYNANEVFRCIKVGLLCVQEHAEDRPIMSSVVLMLSSETATLPQPKEPGFCLGRNFNETDSSSGKQEPYSVNQVTVTLLEAR